MKARSRPAFTVFQLLVLVSLLALLFSLFLPAVAKIRAAANRASSQNNLKQLGLAVHNYYSALGALPPGNDGKNFSTAAYILPYIEQDNVFRQIDMTKPIDDKANAAARATQVRTFLSPRDPIKTVVNDYGATNYLFCAGSKPSLQDNDGMFYQDSKITFDKIKDGTSNTVMAGETLKGDGGTKALDVRRQHVTLDKDALKNLKDESGVQDFKDNKNIAGDRCARWIDGRFLQGTFNSSRTPNDARPDVSCDGLGGLSALRSLDNSVNILMGDGSVRAISTKITAETWKALSTIAGGEAIGADF